MSLVYVLINTHHEFEWLRTEVKILTRQKQRPANVNVVTVWPIAESLVAMGYRKRDLRYLDRLTIDKLPSGFPFVVANQRKAGQSFGVNPVEQVKPRLLEACRKKRAALLVL